MIDPYYGVDISTWSKTDVRGLWRFSIIVDISDDFSLDGSRQGKRIFKLQCICHEEFFQNIQQTGTYRSQPRHVYAQALHNLLLPC